MNRIGFDIGSRRCGIDTWGAVVCAIDGEQFYPGGDGSASKYLRGVLAVAAALGEVTFGSERFYATALIIERGIEDGRSGRDGWPTKPESDNDLIALHGGGRAALARVVAAFDPKLDCGARAYAMQEVTAAALSVVEKYAERSLPVEAA